MLVRVRAIPGGQGLIWRVFDLRSLLQDRSGRPTPVDGDMCAEDVEVGVGVGEFQLHCIPGEPRRSPANNPQGVRR